MPEGLKIDIENIMEKGSIASATKGRLLKHLKYYMKNKYVLNMFDWYNTLNVSQYI